MNLKALTDAQVKYLRDYLEMNVFSDDSPVIMPLLEASVGRILAHRTRAVDRTLANRGDITKNAQMAHFAVRAAISDMPPDALDHITDWLKASFLTGAGWLHNVDGLGRPKKLMKCSSIADLVREADKAMDRLNAQRARSLGGNDERHVADLADGYTLVRLLTPAALDLESSRMHHCVGHGAYDGDVESGYSEIYSLRDRLGRPVITMEVGADHYADLAGGHVERRIRQVQGKRNDDPADEHLAILKPFILASGWEGEYGYWPRVKDIAGTVHDLYDIPAGTPFKDLQVCVTTDHGDITLPEGLVVEGELELRPYRRRIEVGERTSVGSLRILVVDGDEPMVLPESLQVAGEISAPPDGEGIVCVPAHLAGKVRRREARPTLGSTPTFGRSIMCFRGAAEREWTELDAAEHMRIVDEYHSRGWEEVPISLTAHPVGWREHAMRQMDDLREYYAAEALRLPVVPAIVRERARARVRRVETSELRAFVENAIIGEPWQPLLAGIKPLPPADTVPLSDDDDMDSGLYGPAGPAR
ncbi:PcfJ domain-containing protein [Aquibium microcysteis]|uniref:PcfJ domain-containing protein n=1 Tax=Aquibium microcysteis TaxID=675281 RepID=UPI00165D12F1|nr:PcfJ domain-containing protein [Aquibium microcysteis]